ncbi:oligoribonuclease [Buchnera aphidicola (Brachycaudus cardui)]|uniref:Oligoribonuclease n=1 Tax=Buchnera aphidicola (Brachycaudus cardui) TaxID=557993 RepID=A0A4D6XSR3_9GAMM|nr:oligoribonuclease [Buchnera aphidicola]QCI20692.1 oligoribonuclease [Buchnera aphidicola (Brachycaudus cardui)]
MKCRKTNLIWIDLEMTGLNPKIHRIIEIATLITDFNLNIIAEGPVISIHQKKEDILNMDQWNTNVHTKNGLIERVKKSLYNECQAEIETILFLKKWVSIKSSPICGNSVGQDRRFLFQYMPKLENYFHYRCIDVSTLKELSLRWNPIIHNKLKKNNSHRALEDIYESIIELDFYRKHFIKLPLK